MVAVAAGPVGAAPTRASAHCVTGLQLGDQAAGKYPGSQNSLHPAEASGGRGSREQAPKKESLVGREPT